MSVHPSVFAIMTFTLAACATATTPSDGGETVQASDETPDPRRGEEVRNLCFSRSISGFSQNTADSVVVSRGTKDYLITTRFRCRDLEDAQSLALDGFSGCLSRGDRLIGFDSVFGHTSGIPPQPCFIDRIYEWDKDAEAAEEEEAPEEEMPETEAS